MNVYEVAGVVGIHSSHIVCGAVTESELGRLLRNGIPVHLLERLLRRAFSTAHIVPLSDMPARWDFCQCNLSF